MPIEDELQDRRNDYDVTNTVQVSSAPQVRAAVADLFSRAVPEPLVRFRLARLPRLRARVPRARPELPRGRHDVSRHAAHARHDARARAPHRGPRDERRARRPARPRSRRARDRQRAVPRRRAICAIASSTPAPSTAPCSRACTLRAAVNYLENYLPRIGLEQFVPVVSRIVHFTGYELNIDQIELEDPKDSVVGHLLGTADLGRAVSPTAAISRSAATGCTPSSCSAASRSTSGPQGKVLYRSAHDLLARRCRSIRPRRAMRLENNFNRVYRYLKRSSSAARARTSSSSARTSRS